jgi:hypothetical protein
LGNEIYGARLEAQGTLEDPKVSAEVKRKRIEGIQTRLMTSLVFHLGVLTVEVSSLVGGGNLRDWRRIIDSRGRCWIELGGLKNG